MYEFTPRIINHMFQLPNRTYSLNKPVIWVDDSMDQVALEFSRGTIHHFEDLTFKDLCPIASALYAICCFNWVLALSQSSLQVHRVKLVFMILRNHDFNFGKMLYDQIFACSSAHPASNLLQPNLIYQLFHFQRSVPTLPYDQLSTFPSPLSFNLKRRSVASDINRLTCLLKGLEAQLEGIPSTSILCSFHFCSCLHVFS